MYKYIGNTDYTHWKTLSWFLLFLDICLLTEKQNKPSFKLSDLLIKDSRKHLWCLAKSPTYKTCHKSRTEKDADMKHTLELYNNNWCVTTLKTLYSEIKKQLHILFSDFYRTWSPLKPGFRKIRIARFYVYQSFIFSRTKYRFKILLL